MTIPDDPEMIEFLVAMLQDLQTAIRGRDAQGIYDALNGIFERDQSGNGEIWRYLLISYCEHLAEKTKAGDTTAATSLAAVFEALAG